MPFVGEIFAQLKTASNNAVLQEIRDGQITASPAPNSLNSFDKARTFLASQSLEKGDRFGLLQPTASAGSRWIWRPWLKD